MCIIEIWKDIQGYEGIYQVSNYGNVKSLMFGPKNVKCKGEEKLLKPSKGSVGYWRVQLYKSGKVSTICIHRLVAQAFIPNPDNKPFVNHIDSNKTNNHVENLEWVTPKENTRHSMMYGNFASDLVWHGKNFGKFEVLQYSLDGVFIKKWDCTMDIVDAFGVGFSVIESCFNGRNRSSCGYIWIKHYPGEKIETNIKPILKCENRKPRERNRIAQYDKQDNLIRIWDDYLELTNHPSFGKNTVANIMKCAVGKRKSAYGYIWKYM